MPISVGDRAPDFTLRDPRGDEYSLARYRGQQCVVVAFYVLAFTGG